MNLHLHLHRQLLRRRRSLFLTGVALSAALASTGIAPSIAGAATADTTKAFCTQLQTSQAAIGAIPATTKDRFGKISSEWEKIGRFAPAALKGDVMAIAVAYKTANGQPVADQGTTLATIVKQAQNVVAFSSTNCAAAGGEGPGDGGRGGPGGDGGARFTQLRECVTKKGGTLPAGGQGTPPAGQGAQGGGGQGADRGTPFGDLDAKSQAAFDACRTELGFGNRGPGGGGGAGTRNNPQLLACLKKKSVTLPEIGQPGQPVASPTPSVTKAGAKPAAQATDRRGPFDTKTQAAIDACRTELGLATGPAGPNRAGNAVAKPTGGSTPTKAKAAPTTKVKSK